MTVEIDSIDNLLRTLHNAVIKAQQLTEQQHLRQITRYFKDGVPVTERLQVPDPSKPGENVDLDVPTLALVPPNSIKIDELELKFKVRLVGFEGEDDSHVPFQAVPGDPEHHNGPVEIDLAAPQHTSDEDPSLAEVRVTFHGTDPPEAFNRILGFLTVNAIP